LEALMVPPRAAARRAVLGLALAVTLASAGCNEEKKEAAASPLNKEANTKSLQASGDYYRQQHQPKAQPQPQPKK
jgi:hypothetical protein